MSTSLLMGLAVALMLALVGAVPQHNMAVQAVPEQCRARIAELMSGLTLSEKATQLKTDAAAVPRQAHTGGQCASLSL